MKNVTAQTSKPKHEDVYPFGLQNDLGTSGQAAKVRSQVESSKPTVCPHHSNFILPVVPPTGGLVYSTSLNSLQSASIQHSRASSITDLSAEAEILERAIRHNDVTSVKKIVDLHHGRFVVNLHGSVMDKWSGDSVASTCLSQEVEILLRKSQTLLDRFHKQDSVSSTEPETPVIFLNALYIAVEQKALDVARLLLRYGIEPNEGGVAPTEPPDRGPTLPPPRKGSVFSDELPATRSTPSPSRATVTAREDLPIRFATVSYDASGRPMMYGEVYTREVLYTLPALYLAVACRSPEMVQVLLKYGANVNYRDKYGCTPLHIAACQEKVSWECIIPLLENGAKVSLPNKIGVTSTDLLPELCKVQEELMVDIFSTLVPIHKNNNSQHHHGNGRGIFKRLHPGSRPGRQKSHEEEVPTASTTHPTHLIATGRSRSLRNSTDDGTYDSFKEPSPEGMSSYLPRVGSCRYRDGEQAEVEVERNLKSLIKMSSNCECVDMMLVELFSHCSGLIEMLEQLSRTSVHRLVAKLLNQLLQTIISAEENQGETSAQGLCTLLCLSLALIQGGQALQYTALLILNKIIDTSIIRCLIHTPVHLPSAILPPASHGALTTPSDTSAPRPTISAATRRLLPLRKQQSCEKGPEEVVVIDHGQSQSQEISLIGILSRIHPGVVLNILHNAITLHKRVVGTKQQCTPSHRWRHCSYHCLQILSARILLFMSQNTVVQTEMSTEAQLRILVATLDSTHDPQLLCLVLQVVATLAFDPCHHTALVALDVPDALTQLILPSDEWYYTNHSTKFARFVKHHATRTLVYMGLHNRVGNRVYLFDLLDDPEIRPGEVIDGNENSYILATSLPPKLVRGRCGDAIAMSVEGAILTVVKEMEEVVNKSSINLTADVTSSTFLNVFLCTLPVVVHPIIVLRLLVHCLVGARPHRRGQIGSVTVSRASSMDADEMVEPHQRGLVRCSPMRLDTPTSPPHNARVFRSSSVKSTRGELRVVIDDAGGGDREDKEPEVEPPKEASIPSPCVVSRRPSRFASLRRKKSKSAASIAITKSAFDLNVEEDILSFQRQLQNLPRFEPAIDDRDPRFNRPRSRSVPKVTFEGSIIMPPPPPHSVSFHRVGPPPSWAGEITIPPTLTPQLSVDAGSEMPRIHLSVLKVLESWAITCHNDLESLPLVRRDMREFLDRIESLGDSYEEWTQRMRYLVDAGERTEDLSKCDENNPENIDDQYYQLQKLVVSGKLPCAKDEAVVLAGIQLRIEESCPISQFKSRKSLSGPINSHAHLLRPIVEDIKETTHEVALLAGDIAAPDCTGFTDSDSTSTRSGGLSSVASVAFPWRRGFLRQCMERNKDPVSPSIHLESCIPPAYHGSKNIMKLVKEQKRKLFHTSVYESETQLKKLYVQTCRRLPAFGCQMYQVKEILRARTKKKATRLLGIGLERVVLLDNKTRLLARSQPTMELQQWRAGGGRSHDRLVLEFRGTKWSFVTPSASTLKSISSDLWEIMQEIDNKFLEETIFQAKAPIESVKPRLLPPPFPGRSAIYAEELERLQKLLNFPEEIALRLTEIEYALFYQVPTVAYVRHVTHDLSGGSGTQSPLHTLVKRFNEVSSWVTHIIISQPTHEDRKAVVACILRVTISCWNQGNFNGATEFLAGLKSEKLKPFWLSVHEKEEPLPMMEMLAEALLGSETAMQYEEALQRALAISHCKVVPFFGHFIKKLQAILVGIPSLVVLPPTDDQQLEFVSDFHGEDHFMTRIGTGGLINVAKLDSVVGVLKEIERFHEHHRRLIELQSEKDRCCSVYDPPTQIDGEAEYEVNPDLYQPIQPIGAEHGVSFIPLGRHPDLHTLQLLHHGSTVVHWESDSSRLSLVFLQLERSCSMITWTRSSWGNIRAAAQPDRCLIADSVQGMIPGVALRYASGDVASLSLEEGFLELACVKEVVRERPEVDAVPAIKRMGLEGLSLPEGVFSLVFGTNLSDNRVLDFIAPVHVANLWYHGLLEVVRSLHCQQRLSDQRLQWLREQYLQLYYEDGACAGPTPAEAIKIFGGRKWTLGTAGSSATSPDAAAMSSFKRASSLGMNAAKFRKKKSQPALPPASGKESATRASLPASSDDGQPDSPVRKSMPHSRPSQEDSTLHVRTAVSMESIDKSAQPRDKDRKPSGVSMSGDTYGLRALSITHATQLDFVDFLDLFRAFSLRTRKDLKDLFEQLATLPKGSVKSETSSSIPSPQDNENEHQRHGLLTRMKAESAAESHRRKICDAIAVASIVANCAGLDTTASEAISLDDFRHFLATHQGEELTESMVLALIERHEPDVALREQKCLSFEGFAQYLMDKDNYAFTREMAPPVDDMDHPLSHYYVASSHNTYLTGHQLKGESSVELYSQVLLTGCRCVELDCWDGDDGKPLIYHGHTLTTKIPFKNVVEAIHKSAFVTSPYPVILSVENHCSLQQQARMAHIFLSVFGESLVTRYLFDSDFSDDPQLPSPNQLRNRVLIKNKKLTVEPGPMVTFRHKPSKSTSMRTNSIISTGSTASLDDDDFDDEDDEDDDEDDEDEDDDDLEDKDLIGANGSPTEHDEKQSDASKGTLTEVRTDSTSSQDSSLRDKMTSPHPRSQSDLEWFLDEVGAMSEKQVKKQSSQIAQELSDLIIYTQAIKFRGPGPASPSSSVKARKAGAVKRALLPTTLPGTPPLGSECRLESSSQQTSVRRQPSTATCYQVSSLNENTAKKLCRKHALPLLAHTERHLMRTYPAGMRIDSSNFNPVIFWAFGIQMVALNYQTEDAALHLNTAMFEQNGQCGYVLKPALMWDRSHVMYRRFNPWDKDFDGLHATHFSLTVVSGQYVCPSNHSGNPQVEMEVMGIPVDCCKQKTRIIQRNALNPIWNDSFNFKVMFNDLAFLRFTVVDTSSNHLTAQRILPLRCVRPGYRHLRLRGPQNQSLPLSTIFIYTRIEEECIENENEVRTGNHQDLTPRQGQTSDKQDAKECAGHRRRLYFLRVYGVIPDEFYTILKVGQESTTKEVIQQALAKGNKPVTTVYDYVLIEEVQQQWDSRRDSERGPAQRILEMDERPLEAQSRWQGEGRFILKKTGNDPSSRAWISTIMVSSQKEKRKAQQLTSDLGDWEEEEAMFLVCVHNVSPEIPYAILRAPMTATSQDIITQALVKARRMEEPTKFVLIEELDVSQSSEGSSSGKRRSHHAEIRVLPDDEKVYEAQTAWKTTGKFSLKERAQVLAEKKKSPPLRYPSLGGHRWRFSTRQRPSTQGSFDTGRRSSSVREGDNRTWDTGWDQYWRQGSSTNTSSSLGMKSSPEGSPNDKSPGRLKLASLRKLWIWR